MLEYLQQQWRSTPPADVVTRLNLPYLAKCPCGICWDCPRVTLSAKQQCPYNAKSSSLHVPPTLSFSQNQTSSYTYNQNSRLISLSHLEMCHKGWELESPTKPKAQESLVLWLASGTSRTRRLCHEQRHTRDTHCHSWATYLGGPISPFFPLVTG